MKENNYPLNIEKKVEGRAEKIAQAVYLASQHLKDSEPLKWELRKDSIAFLACSRSVDDKNNPSQDVPFELAIEAFHSCSRDLISLLSLSLVAGLVSKINAGLIIQELESVTKEIEQDMNGQGSKDGFVLSEDFFNRLDKGQNKGHNLLSTNKLKEISDKKPKTSENIKDKKDGRVTRILGILKNQSSSTIKDFTNTINDCSEKTIQRELGDLVEKGIVKKEGERRWSRYSLK